MNKINNNISFSAKLDYSQITGGNATRWEKIAEDFEKETIQYPNDTFKLETNSQGGIYFHPVYSDNKLEKASNSYDKGEISCGTTNLLETFSTKTVADLLKRIYTIRKKSDSMLKDFIGFKNKYNINKLSSDAIDNFDIGKVREDYAQNKLKTDKQLKYFDGIEIV